ncbi:MAG: FGGY family carbohydrate kinase, partial [Porticoccaceae bacterium]|nr:FGGY family carbohydrate kinase [Porticoccaceae bacterium]
MYLVLDQGGQSSRAALFSESGELVQLHRQPVGTTHPKKGWVEQSPEEILHSLRHCLAQITDPCAIERAALVTQRSSFVCWHRGSGKALTPVISWQDTRGSAILAAINPDIRQVRAKTGLFPNSHFGASKMTWCIQQCSQVVQAQDQGQLCIGPIATFLLQRLTREGRFLVDPGNAQRTMLYNMESGHWDAQLLEQFAVPQSALPAVVTKASEWGSLDLNGHRVPIELVSGDQNAAFVSLGEGCPETAVINAGTGAFIGVPLPEGDSAPQRLLQTV